MLLFVCFAVTLTASAQSQKPKSADPKAAVGVALNKFPGFDSSQMRQMLRAKREYCIPLPTWIPAGFKVEKVITKIGAKVNPDDREVYVVYARKTDKGKKQSFTIDAGIGGIGDLPYSPTHIIKSAIGEIELCYEPKDDDNNGKPMKRYVRSHWFDCNNTAWAYGSVRGASFEDNKTVMISIDDTKKILESLQRL